MTKFFLIIIMSLSIIVGCSNDKPTAPKVPDDKPIATETIGPEGGILETEDFKLTVPSGAFEQSANLKLSIDETDSASENSATPIYAIEGMPANYSQPLEVRIKYNKPPSGIIYIELGMEAEIHDIDTVYSDVVYRLFDATEENGFITTNLPTVSGKINFNTINKKTNIEKKVTIQGFINGILVTSEHFTIKSVDFPIDEWSSEYQQVLEYFEASYNRFRDLDFDISLSTWRKTITIKEQAGSDNIKVYASTNFEDLLIESYPGLNISGYRYLCDPMLCFLILYAYEIPFEYEKVILAISHWTKLRYDNYWKGLSSYIWIKYGLMRSFNGNYTATTLSVLLEYLVEKYEDGILKNIMLEVRSGKDPILAIISQTQQPNNWLSDFYKSLLTGETWLNRIKLKNSNYSMVDFCKEYRAAEFGIEDTTTIIEWTDNYEDLSAKLYRVALLPGLNEESKLRFTVEGGDAEISLFRYKGSEIEFLSNSENADSVGNIRALSDNGYELIVVVTNRMPAYPNFTNSDITLKIEQISEKPLPKIINCSISIDNIDVNRRTYREDGTYYDAVQERYGSHYNTASEPEPTFENKIFYQAYSFTDDQGFIQSGNFSVQFNDNLDSVLTFSVYHKQDGLFVDPRWGIAEGGISGHDIPLVPSYDKDTFEVTGMEVCEKINNNIKASVTGSGLSDWEIISINTCRPDSDPYPSRLWIKIYRE